MFEEEHRRLKELLEEIRVDAITKVIGIPTSEFKQDEQRPDFCKFLSSISSFSSISSLYSLLSTSLRYSAESVEPSPADRMFFESDDFDETPCSRGRYEQGGRVYDFPESTCGEPSSHIVDELQYTSSRYYTLYLMKFVCNDVFVLPN